MSDLNKEFENAKIEIRSILIGFQKGCSLTEFKREYKKLIGQNVPYLKFHKRNEFEFLASMPDAVRIYQSGNDYHLICVADEKSQHIQKMVCKQKPSKGKPPRRLIPVSAPPPRREFERYSVPPRFNSSGAKRELPPTIKKEACNLIRKHSQGLSLRNFLSSYYGFYNKEFNFKNYGFFTLDECLGTIPELTLRTRSNDVYIYHYSALRGCETKYPPLLASSGPRTQTVSRETTGYEDYQMAKSSNISKSNKPYISETFDNYQQQSASNFQYNANDSWNGNFSSEQNGVPDSYGYSKAGASQDKTTGASRNSVVISSTSQSKRLNETQRNVRSNDAFRRSSDISFLQPDQVNGNDLSQSYQLNANSGWKENSIPRQSETYGNLGNSKTGVLGSSLKNSLPSQSIATSAGIINQKEEKLVYVEEDEGQETESRYPSSNYDLKFSRAGSLDTFDLSNAKAGDTSVGISSNIKMNLRRVAVKYPQGIWAKDFPNIYEDTIKSTFDLHSLGFNDLIDFISSVPDIFVKKSLSGSKKDWLIYPADEMEEVGSSYVKDGSNAGFLLIEYIIDCTRRILQGYPEGIKLNEFLHIYSINCNEPLYIADLGFDSIEKFLTSIGDRVPLKIVSKNGIQFVHFVQFEAPVIEEERESLPLDAASPDTQFNSLKPQVDGSKFIAVYTSTIRDPGHLYIQLQGPEMTKMLSMYDDMEEFYHSSQGDAYRMKSSHIKRGIVCVALWPNDRHWYRAKVLSIKSADTVRVFYVDYGTIQDIPNSLLRYIKKDYVKLSTQAQKSRLAHLRPANKAAEWNSRARERMLKMCQEVALMALIEDIDDDGILTITLCDTNGESDVYINDVLMHEGLAESIAVDEVAPSMEACSPIQLLQAQFMMQAYSNLTAGTMSPEVLAKMTQNLALNSQNLGLNPQNFGLNPQSFGLNPQNRGQNSMTAPLVDLSPPRSVIPPPTQTPFSVLNFAGMLPNPSAAGLSPFGDSAPCFPSYMDPSNGRPSSVTLPMTQGYIPNKSYGVGPIATAQESLTESLDESEIFEDDDDDYFEEFYQKVSNVSKRYVKRIRTGDQYIFHILIVESEAYVSNGDVSALIWNNKESDYLLNRLQHRETVLPSRTLSEEGNKQMFEQFRRFHVKGLETVENKTTLLIYPLRSMILILNVFGHPSAHLRSKIVSETEAFNPHNPIWQELSEIEIPEEEEEFSGVTDDDKLNRLCLYDLKAMKEGIKIRRLQMVKRLSMEDSNSQCVDEMEKLEQLFNKVIERIKQIEQICTMFT